LLILEFFPCVASRQPGKQAPSS